MPGVRRNYKDSLFCHLFGNEKRKDKTLELYNALAGTDYDDPSLLTLTTIEGAVFLGYSNDVSFLIDDTMILFEQQSTHNPNMPLRGLRYLSKLYDKYVVAHELDVYSTSPLRLPTPRYFVLYFGRDERPEREVMRLSDLFAHGEGDLEVTATVLNCNEGKNEAIMEACETLRGYAHLLALARSNADAGMGLEDAVADAVERCIEEGALAEYLLEHRAEVESMLFTIEDEERAMRVHWKAVEREARESGMKAGLQEGREAGLQEGREAGLQEGREAGLEAGLEAGRKEGLAAALRGYMETSGCGPDDAMDAHKIPLEEREELAALLDR